MMYFGERPMKDAGPRTGRGRAPLAAGESLHAGSLPCRVDRGQASGWPRVRSVVAAALLLTLTGCVIGEREGEGPVVQVRVPQGAAFGTITDSLAAHGVIRYPRLFRAYARVTGADRLIKPGTYGFRSGAGWDRVLADLHHGRVLTQRITIPEGWELRRIAPRLAAVTGTPPDSVLGLLADSTTAARFGVPGPTLEGYIYPATYTIPLGTPLDTILELMVGQYQKIWTTARRLRADSLKLSEREVIALASIVEKAARVRDEMPIIAAVYHNRLRIGYPLQADPTVQYALGEHQTRLLYAHIDSVAGNPYNTYRHRGLPPGPIASPSTASVDATLYPADVPFLYFVARPDGSHIFTRSLVEHNRARATLRQERQQRQAAESRAIGAPAPESSQGTQ
jgi:UPF0755 protein